MAISFPSNPTTNQTYTYGSQTWLYNGSVWVLNVASGAVIQVQNTAPSTSTAGTLWWDSDTGDFSVYYGNTWAGLTAAGLPDGTVTPSKLSSTANVSIRAQAMTMGIIFGG